jgi:hypothetical protein
MSAPRFVVIPGDPVEREFPILLTGEGMIVDTVEHPDEGYGFGRLAYSIVQLFESGEYKVEDFIASPLTDVEREQLAKAKAATA